MSQTNIGFAFGLQEYNFNLGILLSLSKIKRKANCLCLRAIGIFKRSELPEMSRGKGVRLQKFKAGGLSDVTAFILKDGLGWIDSSGRSFSVTDLAEWIGERAQAGRLPPKGFPKSNRFS